MNKDALHLFFKAGGACYAVPLEQTKRVVTLGKISEVPMLKDFFEGVFKFENEVVPLLDIAEMHGHEGSEGQKADEKVALVCRLNKLHIGLHIEKVETVKKVSPAQIESIESEYAGVAQKVVAEGREYLLLDINSLEL